MGSGKVVAVEGGVEGEVFDDGVEIDGLGVEVAVFGDFAFVYDVEAVTLEHSWGATVVECDDLAVYGFFSVLLEVVEESINEGSCICDVASFW